MFPVIDSDKLIGCITTKEVKGIPREEWSQKTIGELTAECSPKNTIEPKTDAIKALSIMNQNGASRLMVTQGNRLVGVISLKDLLNFLSLKVELEE